MSGGFFFDMHAKSSFDIFSIIFKNENIMRANFFMFLKNFACT